MIKPPIDVGPPVELVGRAFDTRQGAVSETVLYGTARERIALVTACGQARAVNMGDQDPEPYRQRLEAKLRPERMRATLAFAGLYQMTHELIKVAVLEEVRQFYWRGVKDGVSVYDDQAYAERVLSKSPKNKFRASLLWLLGRVRSSKPKPIDSRTSSRTATT